MIFGLAGDWTMVFVAHGAMLILAGGVALCIFNIATQIYMPYLLIYLNKTLGFDLLTYSIVMAIVILVACTVAVVLGNKIDQIGRDN